MGPLIEILYLDLLNLDGGIIQLDVEYLQDTYEWVY